MNLRRQFKQKSSSKTHNKTRLTGTAFGYKREGNIILIGNNSCR